MDRSVNSKSKDVWSLLKKCPLPKFGVRALGIEAIGKQLGFCWIVNVTHPELLASISDKS